ncbi:sensor histidine kinase [Dictyobacter formicarum]|uniref:histidine kinase n=1 Tax=Dictyobacter formicarum TaxID=2778368 RepID=A0ABQ3VET9_9CHLR|nr:ATP-binding protein [Dictyobacter formicarum]GHO83656.1 hypothetical protein KSZ_16620 [Dictyobacter formicarum]
MTDDHKGNEQPDTISDRHFSAQFLNAELLATLSHELRGPLAIIKGYVTTLLHYDQIIDQNERTDFLRAIDEGSNRLAASIDRLMELAQMESGTIVLNSATISLPHLLRTAITKVERTAPGRQFRLLHSSCVGMPLAHDILLQADQHHLLTAFENILDNALKYSDSNSSIDITLSPVCTDEEKERLTVHGDVDANKMIAVTVRDYGTGIPTDKLEQIFGRFQRVELGLTREINGLGLGLTISRYLIELHHGSIWAESTVGVGTTIHILLPISSEVA